MYKNAEVVEKKVKVLINNMRYLIVISTLFFLFCISLIILGDGELYNIIPIIVFMVLWYLMFYAIYSHLAYRIPLKIDISSACINIQTSTKEIVIHSIDSIEMVEGVNNLILKVAFNGRWVKLYVPKYLNQHYNLDKQVEYMFKREIKTKVHYDFFIRFF